jgi:hypothetical protein
MAIQKIRGGVELLLGKAAVRTQHLVARVAARGDQHHDYAAVRQEPHTRMLDHGFAHRRRYDDSQAVGDFR